MSRVFVIGSGFSTCAGAPLARSVLPAIFNPSRTDKANLSLKNYLDNFLFQGHKDWINNSGLEEVLSRLDLIRHYQPYPNTDYDKVSYFEEMLLGEFTNLLRPPKANSKHRAYSIFKELINNHDAFISFNYDLVVEELLYSSGKNYNYCLNSPQFSQLSQPWVKLLKLHGSINLYYCPECGEVFTFSPGQAAHPLPVLVQSADSEHRTEMVCLACLKAGSSIHLKHFIIAPTLFKSYTLSTLRRLWFQALELLAAADEIIFIGYSLPEADILSYQLFDFGKGLARRNQIIRLVNGPRLLPDRFLQIYGQELLNTGLYFEEWVNCRSFFC